MSFSRDLLIISTLLVILGFTPIASWLRTGFSYIDNPFSYVVSQTILGTKQQFKNIYGAFSSQKENQRLKQANLQLTNELVELQRLRRENSFLKEQLNLISLREVKIAAFARVIGRQITSEGTFLFINAGSMNGVKIGDAIIFKNFLIGIVEKIELRRSLIRLINDPDFVISAFTADNQARGLVRGNFGAFLMMEKIPENQEIKKGDIVLTSGDDGKVAHEFILGEVEEVSQVYTQAAKTAKIKILINLDALREVLVVHK